MSFTSAVMFDLFAEVLHCTKIALLIQAFICTVELVLSNM